MNWYVKASPSLYEPRRLNPQSKATRFFNYIKSKNINITAFHGTSKEAWLASQQKGYLLSPNAGNIEDNEDRKRIYENVTDENPEYYNRYNKSKEEINKIKNNYNGLNQIFFTPSYPYALEYAEKNDNAVVLTAKIPLYAIAEIQGAIANSPEKIYNEQNRNNIVFNIINSNKTDENKLVAILELFNPNGKSETQAYYSEFTTYNALPTKWITDVKELPPKSKSSLRPFQIQEQPQILASNWYRKASPSLLKPNRGREINPKNLDLSTYFPNLKPEEIPSVTIDKNKKLKLFNYIKTKNQTIKLYHGTLNSRYQLAKQSGYLLSANQNKQSPNSITPDADKNFVFMTPNKEYATQSYANRDALIQRMFSDLLRKARMPSQNEVGKAARNDKEYKDIQQKIQNTYNQILEELISNPQKYDDFGVVITLNVPLYAITEVRDAILEGMPKREIGDTVNIGKTLLYDIFTDKANQITHLNTLFETLGNQLSNKRILTSYLGLPLKWAESVEPVSESILEPLIALFDAYQADFDSKKLKYPQYKLPPGYKLY